MSFRKKRSEKTIEKQRIALLKKFNGGGLPASEREKLSQRGVLFHLWRHDYLLRNDRQKLTTDFIIKLCGSLKNRGIDK